MPVSRADAALPASTRDLLLLAVFADDETARAAWMTVAPTVDLGTLPFELHGLFPLLADRLRGFGLAPIDLPRFDGVRKRLWSSNLLRVRAVVAAADELASSGAKPMVTGALAVLVYAGSWGVRPLTETDVVIPAEYGEVAVRVLRRAGWRLVDGRHDGFLRDLRAAVVERGGQQVTIRWSDHGWPYDGLPTASEREVVGTRLPVASAADVLAFTVTDAERLPGYPPVRRFADAMLLCGLDVAGRAPIDWTAFAARVRQRNAAPEAVDFLRYLTGPLRVAVPSGVIDSLSADAAAARRVGGIARRSDTAAAYMRRSRSMSPAAAMRLLPSYLCEVWDVRRPWELPFIAAVRGVRAAGRLVRREAAAPDGATPS